MIFVDFEPIPGLFLSSRVGGGTFFFAYFGCHVLCVIWVLMMMCYILYASTWKKMLSVSMNFS